MLKLKVGSSTIGSLTISFNSSAGRLKISFSEKGSINSCMLGVSRRDLVSSSVSNFNPKLDGGVIGFIGVNSEIGSVNSSVSGGFKPKLSETGSNNSSAFTAADGTVNSSGLTGIEVGCKGSTCMGGSTAKLGVSFSKLGSSTLTSNSFNGKAAVWMVGGGMVGSESCSSDMDGVTVGSSTVGRETAAATAGSKPWTVGSEITGVVLTATVGTVGGAAASPATDGASTVGTNSPTTTLNSWY